MNSIFKVILSSITLLTLVNTANTQNLIPNPSFETISACPNNVTLTSNASPWLNMVGHGGSADLFSTCATSTLVTVPVSYFGNQLAATGNNYDGLCLQYQGGLFDFREYIQTQFTSPLVAGQCYVLSFKYSLADNFTLGTDKLGVYLSAAQATAGGQMTTVFLTPQLQNPAGNFLTDKTNWVTLTFSYTAVGGEQFMLLGNFFDDANTPVVGAGGGTIVGSYIFVDDFSMVQVACTAANPVFIDDTICVGQSVVFNDVNASSTATWTSLATGATVLGTGVPFTVSPSVTTTYVYHDGAYTDTVTVYVGQIPTLTVTNDTTICSGQNVTLNASPATPASLVWSTGSTASSINVSTAGTYSVTATSNLGSCIATESIIVSIETITVGISPSNPSICNGQAVTLTASPSIPANLLWSTSATTASISATVGGNYSVTATTANGCTASANTNVNVGQLPVLTITNDTTICNGQNVTLQISSDIPASFLWSNGSTSSSITVSTAGTYSVTATATTGGCISTEQVIVGVETLTLSLSPSNPNICNGQAVTLTANTNITANLLWNTSATTTSISATTAGNYSVTATTANGCTANAATTVSVGQFPILSLTNDSTICSGSIIDLIASSNVPSSFSWNNGDTDSIVTTTAAGQFIVTATTLGTSCSTTDTVSVNVDLVTLTITPANATICNGIPVTLTAGSNQTVTQNWSTGETSQSILVNQAGTYSVTVTSASGCTASEDALITDGTLQLNLGPDSTICMTDEFYIGGSVAGANQYSWNTGSTSSSLQVIVSGNYILNAFNSNTGCSVTDTVNVTVDDCEDPYFIPNSFSPNGDGLNDVFFIYTEMPEDADFDFYIFNRWGELIFQTNNFNYGWDGTHKGQKSIVDVYVWRLVLYNPESNSYISKTGHVNLVR